MTRGLMVTAGVSAGLLIAALLGRPSPPLPAQLVSDVEGPLRRISIHYCTAFHAYSSETLHDLVHQLSPDTHIDVAVETQTEFDKLSAFLKSNTSKRLPKLHAVVTGFPITPWSKDRYGTMASRRGPVLCVPSAKIAGRRIAAPGDDAVPALLARDGIERRELPFRFDGGDLICSRDTIFMAANCLARNQPYDQEGQARLLSKMETTFGKSIVLLGETPADVPAHHIGMYLTPLGKKTVIVGDPDWGLDLYRESGSSSTTPLPRSDVRLEPFRFIRRTLERQGFKVIPVPLIVTDQPQVYITYNNGILETRNRKQIFYMPSYDIPLLDDAAAAVYEKQGITVRRTRVAKLYRHTGSLRCLVGIVER